MNCNIFSHFATESEVLRSGSALPATKRPEEAKKGGAAPKTTLAKVTKLATPLRRVVAPLANARREEVLELPQGKTAPVALATLVEATTPPEVAEIAELSKPKVVEAGVAPVIAPALVQSPAPPPERSQSWEEEFVAGVEKELRFMALKRKMVELRNALTRPLRNWTQR